MVVDRRWFGVWPRSAHGRPPRRPRTTPAPGPGRRGPAPAARPRPGAPSSRCRPSARSGPAAAAAMCSQPVAGGTGGRASIAALSASIRSSGRSPSTRWPRRWLEPSNSAELGVEVGRGGEAAARQEGAFQIVVEPFHQALGFRVGRLADDHLRAQHAAERLTLARSARSGGPATGRPRPPRPTPTPAAPRPAAAISRHQPAYRSSARPGRHQHRGGEPGIAAHHGQHRQQLRRPGLAEPDRQLDIGKPEVALRDLPSGIRRPDWPGPAADTPAAAPPPGRSTCGSNTASRSAPRSPSPASAETPAATPGSAARTHPPPNPTGCR